MSPSLPLWPIGGFSALGLWLLLVPVVAIGGITIANAPALITAGADFLAVAAGVWEHGGGPQEAVREFNTLFKA